MRRWLAELDVTDAWILGGIAAVASGAGWTFGPGWALMVGGAMLFGLGLWCLPTRRRP